MRTSIYSLAILLLVIACQNAASPEKETNASQAATDHQDGPAAVQLNNGEKWQANPETTQGIQAMLQLTANFSTDGADADYAMLKKGLVTEFETIFKKCTMTGEAHNQLHNYLIPLKGLLEKLDSSDPATNKATLELIGKHLGEYERYFN